MNTIGKRIRLARDQRGLSQTQLADRAGAVASAVSHWETGRRTPDADNLRCLCVALGVSADWLLGLALPDSAGAAIQLQRIRDVLETQQPAQEGAPRRRARKP